MEKINYNLLIKDILGGEKRKFDILYQSTKKNIFLVCMRYARNKEEAEDFLQDAYINIYKSLHQFDCNRGNLSTWMKRVTINSCLQHLRKGSFKFSWSSISDMLFVPSDTGMNGLDNLSLQELTKKIQCLPEGYRVVFNMFVIDGYSHKEISKELNVSESTSKSQLFKAKKHLQKEILNTKLEFKYG